MAGKRTVLFVCTGNSCRSQMAEAILKHLAGDRFTAISAGSHPAGFVHALAHDALHRLHVPADGLESKSWDVFRETRVDVAITLCDAAAATPCPVFPGGGITVHWPLPDPSSHAGTADQRVEFAVAVATRIRHKVQAMIDLDWSAAAGELQEKLSKLGEI